MHQDLVTAVPRRDHGSDHARRGCAVLAGMTVAGKTGLRDLRDAVGRSLARAGVPSERFEDIALAVHEIATNAIVHGGGWSRTQIWTDRSSWYCDVVDGGSGLGGKSISSDPPGVQEGGFGLWIARHAADHVRISDTEFGLHVRLIVDRPEAPAR